MKPALLLKRSGAVIGTLALAGVLVFITMNWNDRPPSPSARRLAALLATPVHAAPEDNGFVHVLAVNVPRDKHVVAVGAARAAWLAQWTMQDARRYSTFPDGLKPASTAPFPQHRSLHEACRRLLRPCEQALMADVEKAKAWVASQQWLHARYGDMLGTSAWHEVPLTGGQMPLPSYSVVFQGQRLQLVHAWLLARSGDAHGVRAMLERDLAFWRRVQTGGANLMTKMMGVAGIQNHFQFASMVMRALPAGRRSSAIPDAWDVEFSPQERSMLRAMAGEMAIVRVTLHGVEASAADDSWWTALMLKAVALQTQDSLNRYADYLAAVADTLAVDYPKMQHAAQSLRTLSPVTTDAGFASGLYNPLGKVMVDVAGDFGDYGLRVADLEAARRAALLAAQLRAANVTVADMPGQVRASPLRNPFTGKPFVWDAQKERFLFGGMARPDRNREAVEY